VLHALAPAFALALAACTSGAVCPSGSVTIATYNVSYSAIYEGDTCYVTLLPDGGSTSSVLISAPSSNTMLLCATNDDAGTPPQLYLSGSALGAPDASTYVTSGIETDVSGSACLCNIDISDSIAVTLDTPDGGPLEFNPDGGVPSIPSFTGRIDYEVQGSAGNTVTCGCNLPCGAHFTLSATQ
jgi:hypothetical protein